MLESDWDYTVESVVSKRPDKPNKYHDVIIGKRCIVPVNENQPPMATGHFIIDAFGHHPSPRWFYTTSVMKCEELSDGKVVLESQNTIYTFTPIKRGVSDDLSGQCSNNSD